MTDRAGKNRKSAGNKTMLAIDSWIDSTLYELSYGLGDGWESVTIFFRRFRVRGFTRALVELVDESITIGLAGLTLLLALALPAFEVSQKDWRYQGDFSITFLDRFGKEIGQRGIRHNDAEEVDALPDHFIKAVLATEDRRFFEHFGIDFLGLVRAMIANVRASSVVQGGSTITQQLAKNLFLTNERTLERKISEAFLALWLEFNVSKKEILKLYLDRAYMGAGNFGIGAAAEYYFGKDVKELNLAEASMLAGLYKAPTKYAPHVNLPAARARANEVLTNLVQAGYMTEGQVITARRRPASIVERDAVEEPNYFLDWSFEEVKRIAERFPARTLIAKTTLDLDLQRAARDAVESHLRQYGENYRVEEAALVCIEHNGAVRAIVGGRDYGKSQFNRATSAKRQAGSSFKPFVYTAAMENGFSPEDIVVDGPVTIGKWSPRNYSGGYRGRVQLTTALVKSINTIPVKIAARIGRGKIVETAHRMGIDSKLQTNPSMPLGTNGVSVMEMATGYATFMSGGMEVGRHGIVQITDSQGNLLYDHKTDFTKPKRAVEVDAIAKMNGILVQIPEWGTGRRAALEGIRAGGKTGTTQAYRDAWFVGFTGNFATAVWFGNDDYTSTARLTGGNLPALTWNKFMTYAHANIQLRDIPFVKPAALTRSTQRRPSRAALAAAEPLRLRPKLLSAESAKLLEEIRDLLRAAPKLTLDEKVASVED